ncbi:hypothetical protein DHW03_11235 [Pedobacter yonginense]|uniref:Peptidase C14 caspase domain-containing protein n=1 Tax=Pedobacter yonginense TaxID=651869 RepID=A0A317EQE3_9SPHI|nr:caspase family protein [Pedobacter yonginense]PWS28119.1 hypothetical protein DHW03_11235 [Pedobacter yonginense]
MHKPPTKLFFYLLCFITLTGFGQNKYAVLVGINDYYESTMVKSFHSLKGCVNDALSIKSLLVSRFNFNQTNVNVILNEMATQPQVISALNSTLNKSKEGDVVIFYFSGHGIYIDNVALNNDPIKKGYNQSLIMSDLYSPGYNCLLKDNTLKKIFNQFVAKKVTLTTIFDCCYSGNMSMTLSSGFMEPNPYVDDGITDTSSLKSMYIDELDRMTRDIDMNVMPIIVDQEIIARPSETQNSNFVAISACKDDEKASEIWDESGVPHGALTKAILSAYEKSSKDISLATLLKTITTEISINQKLKQKPTFHYDGKRNTHNLIGLPLQTQTNPRTATCIEVHKNSITLNSGYIDGFANGNVLFNKGDKITINKVYRDSAIAIALTGHQIKKGAAFVLKDTYRISKPILKIYIEAADANTPAFMASFNKEILPLSKQANYVDYFNWYGDPKSPTYFSSLSVGAGIKILDDAQNQRFAVLLPLPKDLAMQVKQVFQTNQSIKLVGTAAEADKVLYLNYAAQSKNNISPCFVITYRNALSGNSDMRKFSTSYVKLQQLTLNPSEMATMKKSIKEVTYSLARNKGSSWFNGYPER